MPWIINLDFAVTIANFTLSHGSLNFDLAAFLTPEIAPIDESKSICLLLNEFMSGDNNIYNALIYIL